MSEYIKKGNQGLHLAPLPEAENFLSRTEPSVQSQLLKHLPECHRVHWVNQHQPSTSSKGSLSKSHEGTLLNILRKSCWELGTIVAPTYPPAKSSLHATRNHYWKRTAVCLLLLSPGS